MERRARYSIALDTCVVVLCLTLLWLQYYLNTLRPRQDGRRFADDTFKRIFLNENVRISIKISLKFVPKGPINNIPALVQIMAWRRSGDKPLSEPMMVSLPMHICVTRPLWVNTYWPGAVDLINKSHNAPFRTEMCSFLFWMVHCGIWDRCIVGFMNWFINSYKAYTRCNHHISILIYMVISLNQISRKYSFNKNT